MTALARLVTLALRLLVVPRSSRAQELAKVPRIEILTAGCISSHPPPRSWSILPLV